MARRRYQSKIFKSLVFMSTPYELALADPEPFRLFIYESYSEHRISRVGNPTLLAIELVELLGLVFFSQIWPSAIRAVIKVRWASCVDSSYCLQHAIFVASDLFSS